MTGAVRGLVVRVGNDPDPKKFVGRDAWALDQ
jgi:hypothetical protein